MKQRVLDESTCKTVVNLETIAILFGCFYGKGGFGGKFTLDLYIAGDEALFIVRVRPHMSYIYNL